MRNVITSPAQPSIESCVHANLTVFNCMSPRSVENIASQFISEKSYRLFSSLKKRKTFSLKDCPDCRYGCTFHQPSKASIGHSCPKHRPGQTCHGPEGSVAVVIATVQTRTSLIPFVLSSDMVQPRCPGVSVVSWMERKGRISSRWHSPCRWGWTRIGTLWFPS